MHTIISHAYMLRTQELFIRILNHESRSHEKLTQMAIQEQTREEHDRRPDPAKEEADPLSLGANKQKQASSAAVSLIGFGNDYSIVFYCFA